MAHGGGGMSLEDMRAQLHAQLREKGVVKQLKTQLRSIILSDMSRRQAPSSVGGASKIPPLTPSDMLTDRRRLAGDKLVENYLRVTGRSYTHSLFLSESSVHIGTADEDEALHRSFLGDDKVPSPLSAEEKRTLATSSCLELAIDTWCRQVVTEKRIRQDTAVQTNEDDMIPNTFSPDATLRTKLAWVDAHDRASRRAQDRTHRSEFEGRLRRYEAEIKRRLEGEAAFTMSHHKETAVAEAVRDAALKHKQVVSDLALNYAEKEKKLRHDLALARTQFERRQQELDSKALLLESERQELLTSLRLRERSVQTAMQDAQRLRDNALGSSQRSEYLSSIVARQEDEIKQLMTLLSQGRQLVTPPRAVVTDPLKSKMTESQNMSVSTKSEPIPKTNIEPDYAQDLTLGAQLPQARPTAADRPKGQEDQQHHPQQVSTEQKLSQTISQETSPPDTSSPVFNASGTGTKPPLSISIVASHPQDREKEIQSVTPPAVPSSPPDLQQQVVATDSIPEQRQARDHDVAARESTVAAVATEESTVIETQTHFDLEAYVKQLTEDEASQRASIEQDNTSQIYRVIQQQQREESDIQAKLQQQKEEQREAVDEALGGLAQKEENCRQNISSEHSGVVVGLGNVEKFFHEAHSLLALQSQDKFRHLSEAVVQALTLGKQEIEDQFSAALQIIEISFQQQTEKMVQAEALMAAARKFEVVTVPESEERDAIATDEDSAYRYMEYDFAKEKNQIENQRPERPGRTFALEVAEVRITRDTPSNSDDDHSDNIFGRSSDSSDF